MHLLAIIQNRHPRYNIYKTGKCNIIEINLLFIQLVKQLQGFFILTQLSISNKHITTKKQHPFRTLYRRFYELQGFKASLIPPDFAYMSIRELATNIWDWKLVLTARVCTCLSWLSPQVREQEVSIVDRVKSIERRPAASWPRSYDGRRLRDRKRACLWISYCLSISDSLLSHPCLCLYCAISSPFLASKTCE